MRMWGGGGTVKVPIQRKRRGTEGVENKGGLVTGDFQNRGYDQKTRTQKTKKKKGATRFTETSRG